MLLGISNLYAQSQTKEDLQKKKQQLANEIAQTSIILKETQKNKKATLAQLDALRKQILMRERLINTISSEIKNLEGQIGNTNSEIDQLQAELEQLKKEYAAMIRFAFRNQSSYNKLMFVFAAQNFNQAYKRLKYLQQFSEYRQRQAKYIEEAQKKLELKREELEVNKKAKNGLLIEEQEEKVTLGKEKSQQEKMAKQLSAKESTLRKQLQAKQAQQRKLDNQIQAIIKKEIEAARKKAEAEARAKGQTVSGDKNSSSNLTLTPEAKALSNQFNANRGKLPWPVEKGTIIEYFGTHEHPQLKGVMIQNNGIDIKTSSGASARAIFNGTVSGVIQIPGGLNAVLVRHGEYTTVYSNLKSVNVKMGQSVSTKQSIGTVATEEDIASMELQIWKGINKLNPTEWLAR
ncbi:MAG: murein hydrolase activator EnvC family protein [bacterium]